MCLDVGVNPKIPRTKSKAVPEGNGPFPHDEYGSCEPTTADIYPLLKERFDKTDKHLKKLTGEMKRTNQRLAGLQHQAQQPRLTAKSDI